MRPGLPSLTELDAIILDFGGVLFDIDYDAPARAFKKLGLENFEAIYAKANQTPLFDQLETGKVSNEAFLEEVIRLGDLKASIAEAEEAWNSILTGIPEIRVQIVHALKEKKPLYLLSNTNAIHVQKFEQMMDETVGLHRFKSAFEKVYYSNAIGMKKPDPSTFLEVCKWNNLDPKRTLFIDDSPQHVSGAQEAGLYGYHLELSEEKFEDVVQDWRINV